jgi:Mg/Co/Ni transporter MgtE
VLREEAVGAQLVAGVGRGGGEETVAAARRRIAAEHPASVELMCVVDDSGQLLGAFPGGRLLTLGGDVTLREAMDPAFPRAGMGIAASGLISFLPVWVFFGELRLACAVAAAIFAAGTTAAALGLLLPLWIARLGPDPALGSGPLATVIREILSVPVYFSVIRSFGL